MSRAGANPDPKGGAFALRPLAAALALAAGLAGCGQNDTDPGPGGVTVGEARALDEAAAMLEERRQPKPAAEASGESAPEAAAQSDTAD
ncbi:hypothetical protein [Tsuneonella sp. HG222]